MGTIWQPTLSDFDGPKYKAVVAALRTDIAKGNLRPGDKLPPVRDLAWEIHVTPGTIARAYQEGIAAGILQATVGRGTFIASQNSELPEIERHYNIIPEQKINLRNTNTTNVGQADAIKRAMIHVHRPRSTSISNILNAMAVIRSIRTLSTGWNIPTYRPSLKT